MNHTAQLAQSSSRSLHPSVSLSAYRRHIDLFCSQLHLCCELTKRVRDYFDSPDVKISGPGFIHPIPGLPGLQAPYKFLTTYNLIKYCRCRPNYSGRLPVRWSPCELPCWRCHRTDSSETWLRRPRQQPPTQSGRLQIAIHIKQHVLHQLINKARLPLTVWQTEVFFYYVI